MRILSISIIQSRSFSFGLTLQTRSTTEFFHSFERNYVKNPSLVCSWQDKPKTKPRWCKNECSISLYKYLGSKWSHSPGEHHPLVPRSKEWSDKMGVWLHGVENVIQEWPFSSIEVTDRFIVPQWCIDPAVHFIFTPCKWKQWHNHCALNQIDVVSFCFFIRRFYLWSNCFLNVGLRSWGP